MSAASPSRRVRFVLIAAVSENGVIGANGTLPWAIPRDFERFLALTKPHHTVSGRRVFDEMTHAGLMPLSPFAENYVWTSRPLPVVGAATSSTFDSAQPPKVYPFTSVDGLLQILLNRPPAEDNDDSTFYVLGGQKVYETFLPLASLVRLTLLHQRFEGDTTFPLAPLSDASQWRVLHQSNLVGVNERDQSNVPLSFIEYVRADASAADVHWTTRHIGLTSGDGTQ